MHGFPTVSDAGAPSLTLLALQTMPCGCVAAVYQAPTTIVEVELVEAKGPHCRFYSHRAGHVVRLGIPGDPRV
jgi:hypothetical protein